MFLEVLQFLLENVSTHSNVCIYFKLCVLFLQTKIKDRYWVLDECLLRIPDDFDATEQLLKYGLLGTSWKVVQAIDELNKDDDVNFILDENSMEDLDEDEHEKILTIR